MSRLDVTSQIMFGLPISPLTLEALVEQCGEAVETRERLLIGVVNAAKIVNVFKNEELRDSLLECDVIVADGQAVVWASNILSDPLPERVTGIDLFQALLALAHEQGRSVYLLGATAEVLARLVTAIGATYPGLRIVGYRDGYFTADQSPEVAAEIARSGADMLFLGMSSPKKETFLGVYGRMLNVPVLHGVGGSFDILAGVTARAPQTWQRLGLEWAYRVKQEPRRLWKRYAITNTQFVLHVLIERLSPTPRWSRPAQPHS